MQEPHGTLVLAKNGSLVTAEPNGRLVRAGIYLRLSSDPQGTRLAVMRQEKELREMCAARGWQVAAVYVDNDISAFSGKPRKDYIRLLADVEAGALDAVASWHNDRLHRNTTELNGFIEVVNRTQVQVAVAMGGIYDLTTANGRMAARIVGAVAEGESDHKSERLKSMHRQKAERGISVSARRAFGYEANNHQQLREPTFYSRISDRLEVVMDEPALVREATERVLSGDSLRGIVKDWNRRGIQGVMDRPWSTSTLRFMLASAGISGRRETRRRGQAVGQITGPGQTWPAIITVDQSDRLRALLTDRSRRSNGRTTESLLTGKSGTARCGLCGAPLVSKPRRTREGVAVRTMVCPDAPSGGGCGRVRVVSDPVEAIVSEAVLAAIDAGALAALLKTPEDREAVAGLENVEAKLIQNRRDWTDDLISRAVWEDEHRRLVARQREFTRRLEVSRRTIGLDNLPNDISAAWRAGEIPLHKQRAITRAFLEAVVIHPATARGGFDPSRVEPRWRA